ncbi:MAG: hypothetical protein KAI61_01185, partial [Alphaproteobacteria bacterium]|nr:hypothetical protein [Alphaproteobacteria bacterium]
KSVAVENSKLRTEIASLQSKIASMKFAQASVVEGLRGKLSQAQQQISGLASQLTFMNQQKEQLALELEARDKQARILQTSLGSKDRELLAAEIFSMEKDRQISSLWTELVKLKSERDEIIWKSRMQIDGRVMGEESVSQIHPTVQAVFWEEEPSLRLDISPSVKKGFYNPFENIATVVVQ